MPPPAVPISITFMSGPLDGHSYGWSVQQVNVEFVLSIGRRDGSDITLDYDSQVSRLHARVIFDHLHDRVYLEDAGSRNGTFIGDERIRARLEIRRGQLFRVGRTWLRVDPPLESFDLDLSESDQGVELPPF